MLYRKYRAFFLPTILASVSTSMGIIVDSIIVGNMLGPNPMAGVNLCMPVLQMFFTLAALIGIGASTLIAIALGRRDSERANSLFTTSLLALLLIALLLTAAAPWAGGIARWLTPDETLQPLAGAYLQVVFWGNGLILLVTAFTYILRTDGMVRLSSAILIVANVINLGLDVVFIGPCRMGIAGSALATVCGYAGGALMLIGYARSKQRTLRLNLHTGRISRLFRQAGEIVRSGSPAALSGALVAVKVFCINLLVGIIAGSQGVVVFTVCLSCLSFVSMFVGGTAGTMMPILGTLYGERDYLGIRLIFNYTLRFGMLTTGCIVLLFEFLPATVFSLFGVTDPALLAIGVPSLRLFAVSLFGMTVTYLMMYYFMTTQRSTIALTLSVLEGIAIIVPLAWLLSAAMGITGIWVAYILAEAGALGVLYWLTRRERKRSAGRFPDMLLIERSGPELLYDISLKATRENASGMSAEAMAVLESNGLRREQAVKAGIALEEIVDNTARYAPNRKRSVNVDVRISSVDDELLIAVRDDGAFFNPVEYSPGEKEFDIDSILLLKALSSSLSYNRVLALNQTLITIRKADIK